MQTRRKEQMGVVKSRRQVEIERLVLERRQLKRRWRRADEGEREGICVLKAGIKSRLAVLRRAEAPRRRRKKKERARVAFFRDLFKFVKALFGKEKSGMLGVEKPELDGYLREVYSCEELGGGGLELPVDIKWEMDVCPPRWGEVQDVVRWARASSAPGPNGVPYRVFRFATGVLKFLWKLMAVVWKKGVIPKSWRRVGGIFISKEKEAFGVGQFRPISLLNVEGKIFFSVVGRRLVEYLKANRLIDTSVQKAGLPGCSGCLEHTSMIWHQIRSAKKEKRDLRVVFLDLVNAYGSVPHSLLWEAFSAAPEADRRRLVVEQIQGQEEEVRRAKAVTLVKQGQWRHILSGCKVSLGQGSYTWHHNQVLRCLAGVFASKQQAVSSLPVGRSARAIGFVPVGESSTMQGQTCPGRWGNARDWKLLADVGKQLQVPQIIAVTSLRPDMVLYSEGERTVYFVELTVLFANAIWEAYERKLFKYADLVAEARDRGWQAHVRPVEVGVRGFVAKSATVLLAEFDIRVRSLKAAVKELSEVAEKESRWFWLKREQGS
ncbi:uncharacterized protein LOC108923472 [Scleropages formosus]|uniref:uncharacterized protein LOC108923472 n=1 Tax=Scleropages formosus TaxID=113540 RepID=UPI0010FA9726|nr:uncharacterized protein LOC108923472 [Scleropages formosus]